jgi:dTDP-4-dehydrorhamnose reductase
MNGKFFEHRVWITGAGGLIGSALLESASAMVPACKIFGTTRHQIDLTDATAIEKMFHALRPTLILHCAAIANTPACEREPARARAVNVEATRRLAELANGIRFVFFSTDLVFDGRDGGYDETAAVNPLGVYAETKAEAERIVLLSPAHTVVRTSLNGGTSPTSDRGFNETMRRAWETGRTVSLFGDEFRSPIPAAVTARAVWEIVAKDRPGLYHIAGSERLSRWQIGQTLAARWRQLNPQIEQVSRLAYPGPPRPGDTSLNCAKAQALLSFPLPGLTQWLADHPNEAF